MLSKCLPSRLVTIGCRFAAGGHGCSLCVVRARTAGVASPFLLRHPCRRLLFTFSGFASASPSLLQRTSSVRCLHISTSALADVAKDAEGSDKYDPTDPEEVKKRAQKMYRSSLMFFYGMTAFGLMLVGYSFAEYGPEQRDDMGNVIMDEYSDLSWPHAYLKRVLRKFTYWQTYVVEPSRDRLLPEPLPPPLHQPKYTLVVELNHLLVHPEWKYETGWRFKKRPAVEYFLRNVGYPNFELVIYTSEAGDMAHSVVDSLDDPQMPRIMYRLYRDTNEFTNGLWRKRIDLLNRDLRRVIVVDWDPGANERHPENVLLVPKWTGKDDDTALVDLAELLKVILTSNDDDVRPILQYYSQFDDPASEFRRRSIAVHQSELKERKETEKKGGLVSSYAGRLFGYRRHT